jgi:hypothetical protein
LGYELAVSLDVLTAEIIEQPAAPTHHHQQAATAMMITLVLTEMFCEVIDALCHQSDLNLGRTTVGLVVTELSDDFLG